jgi:hypothetical protein
MKRPITTFRLLCVLPLLFGLGTFGATSLQAEQIELTPDSVIGGTGSWAGAREWDVGQFRAQLVADNQTEDEIFEEEQNPDDETGGFWLGKEGDEEEAFVLDLEQAYQIDEIVLYNTHNAQFDDRATFGYELYGSNEVAPFAGEDIGEGGDDLVAGQLMAAGEMELMYFGEDPLEPHVANITNRGPFRYIRFNSVGPFHEEGIILPQRSVGINEIHVFGTRPGVDPCDYNNDGKLDVMDLDLLRAEVKAGTNKASFDVNKDAAVNYSDIVAYVEGADKLNSYIGDANLDGEFNSSDFVALFTAGHYEDGVSMNSTWATGDFSGDGEFDTADLVAAFQRGGYELGPRGGPAAVPEPGGIVLVMLSLGLLCDRRRRV